MFAAPKLSQFHLHNILIVSLLLLQTACSNLPVTGTGKVSAAAEIALAEQQKNASAPTLEEQLAQAAASLQQGTAAELSFYSPLYLKKARSHLNKANKLFAKKKPGTEQQVHLLAIESQRMIELGLNNKKLVLDKLIQSFDHRQVLEDIKADSLFKKEFAKINQRLLGLIKRIEKGDLEKALQGEVKLIEQMTALEVATIEKQQLTTAKQAFKAAQKIDSKDLAPITYQAALTAIKTAKQSISSNPRAHDQIAQLAKAALHAAQHNLHVTREIHAILNISKDEMESHILRVEGLMHHIGSAMGQEDVRYMSLKEQSNQLAKAAKALQGEFGAIKSYAIPEPEEQIKIVPAADTTDSSELATTDTPTETDSEAITPSTEEPVVFSPLDSQENDIAAALEEELAAEAAIEKIIEDAVVEQDNNVDSQPVEAVETTEDVETTEAVNDSAENINTDPKPEPQEATEQPETKEVEEVEASQESSPENTEVNTDSELNKKQTDSANSENATQ